MRMRVRITKPTGRKPMRIGALLLKEVPYKDEWRIDATWRDPTRPAKKRRRHQWFNNWRAAEAFAESENKRIEKSKDERGNYHTFDEAADAWIKRRELLVKNKSLGPDTFHKNKQVLEKHLRPKFGPRRLATITSTEIDDWLLEQGHLSYHTRQGWVERALYDPGLRGRT